MKAKPQCLVCLIRRTLYILDRVCSDDIFKVEVMKKVLRLFEEEFSLKKPPMLVATKRERLLKALIKEKVGLEDPYAGIKRKSNECAAKVIPLVRNIIGEAKEELEKLKMACLCAVAGNAFDFGIAEHKFNPEDDFERMLKGVLREGLFLDDTKIMLDMLKKSRKIVYLCDNAGEIFIDKELVKLLKEYCDVTVVVKGKPVQNDATLEDANACNMQDIAKVITTGNDYIGTWLEECSKELVKEIEKCDFIIAKGMGNYESLTEFKLNKPVFFILKAKCRVVADSLQVPLGANVVLKMNL